MNIVNGLRAWQRKPNSEAKLHVLSVGASERWKRVDGRNKDRGETFHMEITRSMFDYIESTWEPPSDNEIEAVARTEPPFLRALVDIFQANDRFG